MRAGGRVIPPRQYLVPILPSGGISPDTPVLGRPGCRGHLGCYMSCGSGPSRPPSLPERQVVAGTACLSHLNEYPSVSHYNIILMTLLITELLIGTK